MNEGGERALTLSWDATTARVSTARTARQASVHRTRRHERQQLRYQWRRICTPGFCMIQATSPQFSLSARRPASMFTLRVRVLHYVFTTNESESICIPYSECAMRPMPKGNKRSTRRQEAGARLDQVSALLPVLEGTSIDSSMRRRLTRLALRLAHSLKYQHLDVSAPSLLPPNPPPCAIFFPFHTTRSPAKNWVHRSMSGSVTRRALTLPQAWAARRPDTSSLVVELGSPGIGYAYIQSCLFIYDNITLQINLGDV